MPRTAHRAKGVRALPLGKELGQSGLEDITRETVDKFADAAGDHHWIHVDPGAGEGRPLRQQDPASIYNRPTSRSKAVQP
ncbi:MaoC like domain-containing protein [Prauserella flava]|nr:MaoC like domain-containing protein [Prauserella flava]MCR3735962.1 MaoC like domain-containing protein [Prauserella salsuginis]